MKKIYFVRHGEAEANVARVIAGARTDTPLTERGRMQAHKTAEHLKGRQIDQIVSSPLSRAFETAKIIAAEIDWTADIVVSDLLIERDYGSATGLPYDQAGLLIDSGQAVGLENSDAFAERAARAITWLSQQPAKNVLVVSHGGFGQMFGTVLDGNAPDTFLGYKRLDNTEYYEFTIEDQS